MKKMEHLFLGTLLVVLLAMAGCDQGLTGFSAPALTGSVTITGDVRVGATLTAAPDFGELAGTVANLDKTYTWKRSGTGGEENGEWLPIEGASGGTYTPSAEDVDNYIKVEVGVTGYRGALSGKTGNVVSEAGGGGEGGGGAGEFHLAAIRYQDTATKSSGEIWDSEKWTYNGEDRATSDEETWTLNATEQAAVYFVVAKAAGQTIAVSGTDSGKVEVKTEGGALDGSSPGDTLAVVKVDLSTAQFAGGSYTFQLKVSEHSELIKTITVNLTNKIDDAYGVTMFKVTYPGSVETLEKINAAIWPQIDRRVTKDIKGEDVTEEPVDNLYDANRWLEHKGEAETEYLIMLNEDYVGKPVFFVMKGKANVTVRLRGAGGERNISAPESFSASLTSNKTGAFNWNVSNWSKGLIMVGGVNPDEVSGITLVLEENITIDGKLGVGTYRFKGSTPDIVNLLTIAGGTVIMKSGSKITGYRAEAGFSTTGGVVHIRPSPGPVGKLIMKAGSAITGNEFTGSRITQLGHCWGIIIFYGTPDSENLAFERDAGADVIYDNLPTGSNERIFFQSYNSTVMNGIYYGID
jgi:hypothetical protein